MSNKTNASGQLNNYREIASAIKKSIEASGRVPPHKSVGAVLYRFLCTVSGNDVTLRNNNWTAADWENSTINASIKYTLTESEHVKWNNVQVAAEILLSQIVFSNKDDIFGLFLKWIKSEKETSMYIPSGFLPHGITETIKTHNESEKQKTFDILKRVFKTNYDSTLIHIVNAMADQPSTEDTFVALSEKAMAELLKHEAENIKLKAINSSLTAVNNNLRHNDNNNPDILKITKESVFNRLKGLFPDNKAELIKELTDSFANKEETKNKYHVAKTAELFAKDVDIHHYKNQIECLLHEAKVKSMKIVELEQQIADLHRKYTTPVITVGSVAPTIPKEPEFDSKTAIEHLRTLVTLQETRLQKLEQTKIAHNSISGAFASIPKHNAKVQNSSASGCLTRTKQPTDSSLTEQVRSQVKQANQKPEVGMRLTGWDALRVAAKEQNIDLNNLYIFITGDGKIEIREHEMFPSKEYLDQIGKVPSPSTNSPSKPYMSNSTLVHDVDVLFMICQGREQCVDANEIASYNEQIRDLFFAVERELVMRTDESISDLAHSGYKVSVNFTPILDADPLCARLFHIGKDGRNLSFAFYDSTPVRG